VPLSTKGQWGHGVSSEKGCFAICSGQFLHDLYLFWFDITHESEHQWTTMNTDELQGWIFTSMGLACFSLSFVTVRLGLREFDPGLIALARGAGAGLFATGCILVGRYRLAAGRQILRLGQVAVGIVFVFPIFTTVALQTVPASHAATIAPVRCRSLSFGQELWLS
jgi:hypothetical protein